MRYLFSALIIFCAALVTLPASAQIGKILDKAKEKAGLQDNSEVGNGLKEALNVGISKGADLLSVTDGYYKSIYKILLPDEARQIVQALSAVPGFGDVEEKIIEKMNRAAEDAATKAKPIFQKAIREMSFKDAMNILMGADDAATKYLHQATYQDLYAAFQPVIVESLNKVNAITYWESAITAYNKIPLVKKANPRLDDYVTTKALEGLFSMVAKEEKAIRTDVNRRTSDLLKRVFAKQDKK